MDFNQLANHPFLSHLSSELSFYLPVNISDKPLSKPGYVGEEGGSAYLGRLGKIFLPILLLNETFEVAYYASDSVLTAYTFSQKFFSEGCYNFLNLSKGVISASIIPSQLIFKGIYKEHSIRMIYTSLAVNDWFLSTKQKGDKVRLSICLYMQGMLLAKSLKPSPLTKCLEPASFALIHLLDIYLLHTSRMEHEGIPSFKDSIRVSLQNKEQAPFAETLSRLFAAAVLSLRSFQYAIPNMAKKLDK